MQDQNSTPAPAETGTPTTPVTEVKPGQVSHDTGVPKNLEGFMLSGWKPFSPQLPEPIVGVESFGARRRALSAAFPGETLVIPTGHEKVRSNDTHFRFRPCSEFFYFTGNHEADCVLVLEPLPEGGHRSVLYVEPVSRDDLSFYTDRNKGELWVGRRLGVEHSKARFGVDLARSLRELEPNLQVLLQTPEGAEPSKIRFLRGFSEKIDALRPSTDEDTAFAATCSEQRLLKDALELAELQTVINATARGFEDAIRVMRKAGATERDIEVAFYARARTEGNDVGYGTIAACGHHACILHWTRNDALLVPGQLLLLDAGVEGNSLYTADITRTVPVSGKFSKEQREIYQLVLDAQRAAMAAVKPGVDFMTPNKISMAVLAKGLEQLGILPMSAEEALKEENQFYRRYSLHNISHMLGIDVHDCAKARKETYRFGPLKPGMVFTVEPGLYFQLDDLTVPERYRGIGVRIEDDIVVTEDGYHNLSAHIPVEVEEVEAWVSRVWGL
jgi:Xaa-Pro aminopeptidase